MARTKDFEIRQGETFTRVVRWGKTPYLYSPISAIQQGAPVRITAVAHGIPDGWRAAVVSVHGMRQINAANSPPRGADFNEVTAIDANTVTINAINSADFSAYTSGGFLQHYTPVDLTGFTARLTIYDAALTTLLSLTTEDGDITVDDTSKTITVVISATDTAALTWTKGKYELDMIGPTGIVTTLLVGSISVIKEPTT